MDMTDFIHMLTVICPELHADKANHLAAVLSRDPNGLNSFTSVNYEDELGNRYLVINTRMKQVALDDAGGVLVRPDCDTENQIDMIKAAEAQTLIKWDLSDVTGSLTCSLDPDYFGFIESAGLIKIQVEIE